MARRIDFYDDPKAPVANSLVPSVNVVVTNDAGDLLASNGEARQEFSIVLTARALSGGPTPSSESTEVRWVPRELVEALPMDRSMALRIGHYLTGTSLPHIG
jgi:hypothetical protein